MMGKEDALFFKKVIAVSQEREEMRDAERDGILVSVSPCEPQLTLDTGLDTSMERGELRQSLSSHISISIL